MNKDEKINALNAALEESVDGADSPHQEVINKMRYERINERLREVIKAVSEEKAEVVEIEDMKGADYVQVYVARSEKTQGNPNDALLTMDSRIASILQGVMGMNKEAGELSSLLHDRIFNGTSVTPETIRNHLGNLSWFMAILLREYGISLEEVLLENLAKLDRKFPKAGVLAARDPDEEL